MSRLIGQRVLTSAPCGVAGTELLSEPISAGPWARNAFSLFVAATTAGVPADPPEDPPVLDVKVQILAEPSVDGVNYGDAIELVASTAATLTGGVLYAAFAAIDDLIGCPAFRLKFVALSGNPEDVLLDVWLDAVSDKPISSETVFMGEPVAGEVEVVSGPICVAEWDSDVALGLFVVLAGDAPAVDVSVAVSADGTHWLAYDAARHFTGAGTHVLLGQTLLASLPLYAKVKLTGVSGNGEDTTVSLAKSYGRRT